MNVYIACLKIKLIRHIFTEIMFDDIYSIICNKYMDVVKNYCDITLLECLFLHIYFLEESKNDCVCRGNSIYKNCCNHNSILCFTLKAELISRHFCSNDIKLMCRCKELSKNKEP